MYLLTVRGRTSGQPRTVSIAIIRRNGKRYVGAPFGVVAWVRNLRAAGEATLTRGRRAETVTARELPEARGGPQSLTQRDKVRLIGEAIGREVLWEEISPQQVREAMLAQGLPVEIPDRLLGYLASRVGQPGPSSTDVEQVLGRSALTFTEWAAEHAAAFRN